MSTDEDSSTKRGWLSQYYYFIRWLRSGPLVKQFSWQARLEGNASSSAQKYK